jgi:hypothetical protein
MFWACKSAFLVLLEILAVILIAANGKHAVRKEWPKIICIAFCLAPHSSSAFRTKPISGPYESHESSKSTRAEPFSHISATPSISEQAVLAFVLKANKATQLVELSLQMIEASGPE